MHSTTLNFWKTIEPEEAAAMVANLRYDKLKVFLLTLSKELQKDSEEDMKNGHPQLSKSLRYASYGVFDATFDIERAWQICKPHENG